MKKETKETNRSLSDPELREKITYNILKKFAKKKNWKDLRALDSTHNKGVYQQHSDMGSPVVEEHTL